MANDVDESPHWLVHRVDVAATGSGVLDGVTVAVKELVAVAGVELTANTEVVLPARWRHPTHDATIIARLRAAGARIVATATTHELAWGITTHDRGRTVVNPHDPQRIAGGSSGGSAVAVATRAVGLAVGTDTAGSVRIPAAWCDVFGWKAGRDAIPTDGVLPLAPLFDHVGLLAADADMLARAVGAVVPPGRDVDRLVIVEVAGAVADDRAHAAVDRVVQALVAVGVPVDDSRVTVPATTIDAFAIVQRAEALRAHTELIGTWPAQAERYALEIRHRLELARNTAPAAVADARHQIDALCDQLRSALDGAVAVLPATGCVPPSVDLPDYVEVSGRTLTLRSVVLPWTTPANIAGLPAVTVPWRVHGEPFGVQLIGGPGSDRALVDLATAISSAGRSG